MANVVAVLIGLTAVEADPADATKESVTAAYEICHLPTNQRRRGTATGSLVPTAFGDKSQALANLIKADVAKDHGHTVISVALPSGLVIAPTN